MMDKELDKLLSREGSILFVGLGNRLRRDDGAGVYICSAIKTDKKILSLNVEVSIENYIGKINSLNPSVLVLIDCMDMNATPGTWRVMPVKNISDTTFNTHTVSLQRIGDFFSMPAYILGIQPERIDFGEEISYIVKDVADRIIKVINREEVYYGN